MWQQFFLAVAVMFKRDKLNVDIRDRTIAVDIVAIATFLIIEKSRGSCLVYFLARNLKNEEQESRRKKVKDTPLVSSIVLIISNHQHQINTNKMMYIQEAKQCMFTRFSVPS